ncbi:MAG: hypothetical protein IPK82_05710 [Polyangiaceae bacterium]|nr:hypothetical protein [Polyangiaceae bacterium]
MAILPQRAPLVFGLFAGLFASVTACGASINAVYESDVRFEHCMALDEEPSERHTARKECWDEWVEYYTFGQTRDRVEYAQRRRRQLNGSNAHGDVASVADPPRAVPEPTTVSAPPPMMIADASAPPPVDSGAADAGELPGATCAAACTEAWPTCKKGCSNAACEKACTVKFKTCMRRCY